MKTKVLSAVETRIVLYLNNPYKYRKTQNKGFVILNRVLFLFFAMFLTDFCLEKAHSA